MQDKGFCQGNDAVCDVSPMWRNRGVGELDVKEKDVTDMVLRE